MSNVIESKALRSAIGPNVRRLRQIKGLSQEALAEAVGCNKEHISRIETGVSSPSTELLFSLADFFGVSADSLRQVGKTKIGA